MALLSLIVAQLIEQIRPLPKASPLHNPLVRLAHALEAVFNAGRQRYGMIAWCLGVGGLTLLCGGVYAAFSWVNPLLGWLWTVGVLYLTMGFRRFSHYYSDIQFALRMDDLPHARQLLAEWGGQPTDALGAEQVARRAIELALAASHRHVFGVIAWFVVLPGPCGAVLYRAATVFAECWAARDEAVGGRFGRFGIFARRAFACIDWLPARLTAAGFAVVGNFENAVYCWRTQAEAWPEGPLGRGVGIVLASGAGALGVRLGEASAEAAVQRADAVAGVAGGGEEANVDLMQSTVGLLWRALLLCLLLLLLLSVSNLFD